MIFLIINFVIWLLSMWMVLVTNKSRIDTKIGTFLIKKFWLRNRKGIGIPDRYGVYIFNRGEVVKPGIWERYENMMLWILSILIFSLFLVQFILLW